MRIIANHAHLMPENSWLPGDTDMLLRYMDSLGIEMAVVFPPFACQVENSMRKANFWAWDEVKKHPDRLIICGTLFPLASDAIELLRILADKGGRIVKIHPSIDLHDVSDPRARPFYAEAERLGMVLDYHTGPHGSRLSFVKPEKYDDIAWDFGGLKFIFEHMGGRTYFEEFLAIICNHPPRTPDEPARIYGGLTSVLQVGNMWYLGPEKIMDVVRIAGADRLIFGLDFPWNKVEDARSAIEKINHLDITEEDKEKILGGNLLRLIGKDKK